MYVDKKIITWIRDFYDDKEVTLEELINDPETEKGFIERENLYELDEPVVNLNKEQVYEIFAENGDLLYKNDTI